MALSPDGKLLVTVGKDNKVLLWDVRDDGTINQQTQFNQQLQLENFQAQQGSNKSVEFIPNTQRLAALDKDGKVWFLNTSEKKYNKILGKIPILSWLWNTSEEKYSKIPSPETVQSFVLSRDGRQLATISKDKENQKN